MRPLARWSTEAVRRLDVEHVGPGEADGQRATRRPLRAPIQPPEYEVAFDAWLKTDPFHNPSARPDLAFMPEYVNSKTVEGQTLNDEATATFDEGTESRETADRYVRQTVLLATVLFLVAIAQRFKFRGVRTATGVIALLLLLYAVSGIVTLPRI